jgi:Na+/H+-dicarboxylate symporter
MTFTRKILIGLFLGIALGLFDHWIQGQGAKIEEPAGL